MSKTMSFIVSNLNSLMSKKGFNQKLLSEKSGISKSNISAYLNAHNEPSIEVLEKLGNALGGTVGDLVKDPNSNDPSRSEIESLVSKAVQQVFESKSKVEEKPKQIIITKNEFLANECLKLINEMPSTNLASIKKLLELLSSKNKSEIDFVVQGIELAKLEEQLEQQINGPKTITKTKKSKKSDDENNEIAAYRKPPDIK